MSCSSTGMRLPGWRLTMVVRISASVGQGGVNKNPDVLAVQKALNRIPGGQGGPTAHLLKEDGLAGMKTSEAITAFQKLNIGLVPTGRIDVNSPTLTRLNSILDKLRPREAPL